VIRWEAPQGAVACSHCGSEDTDISFEFLAFTRRVCRRCGDTFYTFAGRSTDRRVFGMTRRKSRLTKER
jgi:hypothetical protein